MQIIGEAGAGVVVVINRPMPDVMTRIMQARAKGLVGNQPDMAELRDYGVGAQILTELGVHDMILLTNSHHTLVGLAGYDLSIVGEQILDPEKDD